MAFCELPGLRGQQHGKIRFGTMLHDLSILFHNGLFLKWQYLSKRQSLKNCEINLFLGMECPKVVLKQREKSADCHIWF